MAGIQTGIELQDNFTNVIYGIINSVNLAVCAVEEMSEAVEADIDMSSMEGARDEINQATMALYQLNDAIASLDAPVINMNGFPTIPTANPVEVPYTPEQSRGPPIIDTIKGAAAAYVSIQGIEKVMNISDELVQTTSRLDMMNDGLQTTDELVNMVYAAAQDARGSFSQMADVVARFGNNAKDAFGSSEEVVAFADLIQKQMTIAGASTQESSNAMLQLSQALGSGVLRGDELNSIFEQAPNLIQNIADYLGVSIGSIREMASDGELTADIVKAAIFSAADDINAKFEEMPMTWGQVWQSMQNTALMVFQPILQRINSIANNDAFQSFVNTAIEWLAVLAAVVLDTFEFMGGCAAFVADNWSVISPIVYGIVAALAVYGAYLAITKGLEMASAAATGIHTLAMSAKIGITAALTGTTMAATAAQMGYNGALYACPIVWIIALIIALIALIVLLCNWIAEVTGATSSGIGIITGALSVAVAFIGNLIVSLLNLLMDIIVIMWNYIAAFVNFFGNVFTDPIGSIARLFADLADYVLGLLQAIAGVIDSVFGSNLADSVQGWRDSLSGMIDKTFGQGEEIMATARMEDYHVDSFDYENAWNAGAAWGDGIAESIDNFSLADAFGVDIPNVSEYTSGFDDVIANTGISDNIGSIAESTGAISDSLDVTQEEMKYLRDMAEQETVNRYTVAEITIDQSGMQNNISSGDDIDGFMTKLTDSVNEAVDNMTEGVHE